MKKVKVLSIISSCLFAVNVFWIWFFISHRPPHRIKKEPKTVIIEILQFNEGQKKAYEKLIAVHREKIQKEDLKVLVLKNQLYLTLRESPTRSVADSLIAEIGEGQAKIEHINYKHFQDISKLCNPEQQILFYELCKDIAELFTPPAGPKNEKH